MALKQYVIAIKLKLINQWIKINFYLLLNIKTRHYLHTILITKLLIKIELQPIVLEVENFKTQTVNFIFICT